jgi:hypothetical protein
MNEQMIKRIGFAASIVGAVGALVYLVRKPPASGLAGPPGPAGAPGATYGIPGATSAIGGPGGATVTPGTAGLAAAADAPLGAGVPGAPAATVQDVTPSGQSLNQYFASQFYLPEGANVYLTGPINSNVPPGWDLTKSGGNGNGAAKGGCGCGGGCSGSAGRGCGGGTCPNQPEGLRYPDGAGACASTTIPRLQKSMDQCSKGSTQASLNNMMGSIGWWPLIPGDVGSPGPAQWADANYVGPSRFGAA